MTQDLRQHEMFPVFDALRNPSSQSLDGRLLRKMRRNFPSGVLQCFDQSSSFSLFPALRWATH